MADRSGPAEQTIMIKREPSEDDRAAKGQAREQAYSAENSPDQGEVRMVNPSTQAIRIS